MGRATAFFHQTPSATVDIEARAASNADAPDAAGTPGTKSEHVGRADHNIRRNAICHDSCDHATVRTPPASWAPQNPNVPC